jgi:hypothetical protein
LSGVEQSAESSSPGPSSRREVLAIIAIVVGLALFMAARSVIRFFSAHPTSEQCSALLDRYVEHLAHAAEPSPVPSAVQDARVRAREKAERDPEFVACTDALTRAQADCAMAAHNADEFERCLQ